MAELDGCFSGSIGPTNLWKTVQGSFLCRARKSLQPISMMIYAASAKSFALCYAQKLCPPPSLSSASAITRIRIYAGTGARLPILCNYPYSTPVYIKWYWGLGQHSGWHGYLCSIHTHDTCYAGGVKNPLKRIYIQTTTRSPIWPLVSSHNEEQIGKVGGNAGEDWGPTLSQGKSMGNIWAGPMNKDNWVIFPSHLFWTSILNLKNRA